MGMREEIEALRAHVSVGGVELLPRSAVLRIIDKHAAPVVDMTPGMQPRQPSNDVGELPAWLRELEQLRRKAFNDHSDEMPIADHRLLAALFDLRNLADCIKSDKGEAVIPEGVAKFLMCISDSTEPPSPAGTYRADGESSWRYQGSWKRAPGGVIESSERILSAIDSYANSLINP